jgi:hypothetical protein
MSIKKILLLAGFGLTLGGLTAWLQETQSHRFPASALLPAPRLKLQPWSHSLNGKMNQAITVEISAVGGVPESDDQELRLKAEVTVNQPIQGDMEYVWTLPADASLVSGELSDVWAGLQAGQTATAEISVLNVSKESVAKTVTLHVSAEGHGVKYASSGSFATNSREQMAGAAKENSLKMQNSEELVLKKSKAALKLEKVHQ